MTRFLVLMLFILASTSMIGAQEAKTWLCKDGTIVSGTSEVCANRGGVKSELTPQKVSNAAPKTAAARCKDGTTEFASGTDTCEGHKGIAFSFPASGLSDSARSEAVKTDSLRQLARCKARIAKGETKAGSCKVT